MGEKIIPILFRDKKDCCGCGACMNICAHHAISMQEDQYGFLYPHIDPEVCVNCGLCKMVCNYQNHDVEHIPLQTYAAIGKDIQLTRKSTSGGIFASIAKEFLEEGGYVCGASFDDDYNVKHIIISKTNDLDKLQGSKYLQSSIGDSYSEVKKLLIKGEKVLFSGTPCQVDGLYGFLRKSYDNLTTIDIVCHGVPNSRMFHDYLNYLEKKNNGTISSFVFRDKELGWGCHGKVVFDTPSGKIEKKQWESSTSYIHYFRGGWIYRENCYHCKYACEHRPADITLGDFWGIEKAHPEYLGKGGWNEEDGLSLVVANTDRGVDWIKKSQGAVEYRPSAFDKASARNGNLKHPTPMPSSRQRLLESYNNYGWGAIEEDFRRLGWRRYTTQIKMLLPQWLKRTLKKNSKE